MRGWYNIHDHESLRFGFVPHIDSVKESPRLESLTPLKALPEEYLPQEEDDSIFNWQTFFQGYILGIICGLVLMILVVKFCIATARRSLSG